MLYCIFDNMENNSQEEENYSEGSENNSQEDNLKEKDSKLTKNKRSLGRRQASKCNKHSYSNI